MAPDAPAVIRLYPRDAEIVAHIQGLTYAERLPVAPAGLDLDNWEDVLDRAEDAIDRVLAQAEAPAGGQLVQGNLSTSQLRYLAIREYADHLGRFIQQLDRQGKNAGKPAVRMTPKMPVRPVRGTKPAMLMLGDDTRSWRDLRASQDLKNHLVELQSQNQVFGENLSDRLVELIHETALLQAMEAGGKALGDRCLVWLRSPVEQSADELTVLATLYINLFARAYGFVASHLETSVTLKIPEQSLLLEMPGISEVMATEQGTHLFTGRGGKIVPIQVHVTALGPVEPAVALAELRRRDRAWRQGLADGTAAPEDDPFPFGPVARMYDEASLTVDLRSGLALGHLPSFEQFRKFVLCRLATPPEFSE